MKTKLRQNSTLFFVLVVMNTWVYPTLNLNAIILINQMVFRLLNYVVIIYQMHELPRDCQYTEGTKLDGILEICRT